MLQQVKAEFDAKGLPLAYYQLDAYWYDIDPEYTRKRRAKGDMTDRVELGAIERRMAYGYDKEQLDVGATCSR